MEHKMDTAKDKQCHDSVLACMELERGAKHHVTYLALRCQVANYSMRFNHVNPAHIHSTGETEFLIFLHFSQQCPDKIGMTSCSILLKDAV